MACKSRREQLPKKKECVCNLVENQGKQFDVLFIKPDSRHNENFAGAKVDPLW